MALFGNKVKCARCGLEVPRLALSDMSYCKAHRAFFCKNCAKFDAFFGQCPWGSHETSRGPTLLFIYGLVLILSLALIGPVFLSSFIPGAQRHEMPVTIISDIKEGQYVKIEGHIRSNGSIPISGYLEETSHGTIIRNSTIAPNVNISDSSGLIEVYLKSYSKIYIGPSSFIDSSNKTVSEYRDNDPICVIGTVETGNNGQLILRADYIAKNAVGFGDSLQNIILTTAITFTIGMIPVIVGYWYTNKWLALHRMSEHERNIANNTHNGQIKNAIGQER
jgi:hypothetical protein